MKIFQLRYIEFLMIGGVLVLSAALRFVNISYSEFQGDEVRALYDSRLKLSDFVLEQRKGPVQFYVTYFVKQVFGYYDEGLVRLPFAIAGLISVFLVYLLAKELYGKKTAFIAALLFSVNGFSVAFSRIAQYQSFTYMFYLFALLCFVLYYRSGKLFHLPIGALSFALSFLSHYDAVFALLPCVFFIIKGIHYHKFTKKTATALVCSLFLFLAVSASFYFPFFTHPTFSNNTGAYLFQRIGGVGDKITDTFVTYKLYNPFISAYFLAVFAVLGLLFGRIRVLPVLLWFGLPYFFLNFVTSVPGTHIYNYVLPLIFLASYGAAAVMNYLKQPILSTTYQLFIASALVFLGFQSFMLFVDHKPEYPWKSKKILFMTAERPDDNKYNLSIFGFPYNRRLKEVGFIVQSHQGVGAVQSNEGQKLLRYYVNPLPTILPEFDTYIYIYNAQSFVMGRKGKVEGLSPDVALERDGEPLVDVYFIRRATEVK